MTKKRNGKTGRKGILSPIGFRPIGSVQVGFVPIGFGSDLYRWTIPIGTKHIDWKKHNPT